jgi:hypothetical protein
MQATFSRPDKLTDGQTILYEIDMLRFAASRLLRACLECFLVHYRNLIEFLGREQPRFPDTDLHVSNIWQRLGVAEPAQLSKIREQGGKLWHKYEGVKDKISVYLQHCTTLRTESKSWEVGVMIREIERVLSDVEKAIRDGYQPWTAERPVEFLGAASYSGATGGTCPAVVQSFSPPVPPKSKR